MRVSTSILWSLSASPWQEPHSRSQRSPSPPKARKRKGVFPCFPFRYTWSSQAVRLSLAPRLSRSWLTQPAGLQLLMASSHLQEQGGTPVCPWAWGGITGGGWGWQERGKENGKDARKPQVLNWDQRWGISDTNQKSKRTLCQPKHISTRNVSAKKRNFPCSEMGFFMSADLCGNRPRLNEV